MPIRDYPLNADFLLPIVKIPLTVISLIFQGIEAIGPIGQILLVAIIIGLLARNVMGPARV